MIRFYDKEHLYTSDDIPKWLSVSTMVHSLCPVFDAVGQSEKSSKNKKSKWYGVSPETIRQAWDNENKRSTELGSWYHNKMEQEMYSRPHPSGLPIRRPDIRDGVKYAGPQQLSEGIYPEHLCYLQSAGICGQSDIVTIQNNTIIVDDYKTNKEIRTSGYYNWDTGTEKMLGPLSHLDHCEWVHYALQLSTYAYIIHRHNPKYIVGPLTIHHIQFEQEGSDQWGYPIYKLDDNQEPIVSGIIPLNLPYMKKEVELMIQYIKNNKH